MASLVSLLQTNAIQNGVFNITFSIFNNSVTPALTQLFTDFGEPTITVGGTYTPEEPTPSFVLPSQVLRLVSDLPVTFVFDPANPVLSSTYAQEQAAYFATQYQTTFNSAIDTLKAMADTFSGESIINFPTS